MNFEGFTVFLESEKKVILLPKILKPI